MTMMNQLKTVILLGTLTGLLLWVGHLLGGMSGLTFALIFSIIMNFGSYWFSDKIVLAMYRAKQITNKDNPRLYRIVQDVAMQAKTPMPKVYIVPSRNPNAFATGRNPKNAAVAANTGILELLNDQELKGVIAHEVAHIKNRDILIQSVAATIAGVISYVAFIARWGAIFGGIGGRDRNGGGAIEFLVLAILTPLLATIIQLAISRSREFHADATGAGILRNGHGLASALEKLEKGVKNAPLRPSSTTETTAHMMIVNPFVGGGLLNLFSTHPPIKERVRRLKTMSF